MVSTQEELLEAEAEKNRHCPHSKKVQNEYDAVVAKASRQLKIAQAKLVQSQNDQEREKIIHLQGIIQGATAKSAILGNLCFAAQSDYDRLKGKFDDIEARLKKWDLL